MFQCKKIIDGGELISISGEVSEEDESLDPDWRRLNRKVSSAVLPSLSVCLCVHLYISKEGASTISNTIDIKVMVKFRIAFPL